MFRPRWWLVAPALLASAVLNAASAAEIRDKAGMFSPDAVKKAEANLNRLEKEYDVPVTIETITSLDGEKVARVLDQHAQAVGAEGIYILIAKNDHDLEAGASKHFTQYLTRTRLNSIQKAFSGEFKGGNFDAGLSQAVDKMDSVFADAKTDAGGSIRQKSAPNARRGGVVAPARPAPVRKNSSGSFSLLSLIIGGLVLFFVFRIIAAVFRAMRGNQYGGGPMMGGRGYGPGPGGPGYGGGGYGGAPAGGGGFMSSLFGGIGGAMAGNWLYDRMSGGHQGGAYTDQAGYDAAAAPVEDASPEWNTSSSDATNWGDGGVADNSSAGGDWGGGGGGDWGGGGGGGGDWGGGGDDNGGSW